MYQNLVKGGSVHLEGWPEAEASLIDEELLAEMELLIKVTELGRSARSASGIQVRQPLGEILVRVGRESEVEALRKHEKLLKEELNVKGVRFLDIDSEFLSYTLRPNLPVVGKRLGGRVPEFVKKLREMDGRVVAENVRLNKSTKLELGGEEIEFEVGAFLVDVKSPEGYAAVEEGSYLVALNTDLSRELIIEGQVRNLLRHVQNGRKQAGLKVSEYIQLGVSMSEELRVAMEGAEEYIRSEGLVSSVVYGEVSPAEYRETVKVGGCEVTITIQRETKV
jgi:isoleucyl-tRNA synthetase